MSDPVFFGLVAVGLALLVFGGLVIGESGRIPPRPPRPPRRP